MKRPHSRLSLFLSASFALASGLRAEIRVSGTSPQVSPTLNNLWTPDDWTLGGDLSVGYYSGGWMTVTGGSTVTSRAGFIADQDDWLSGAVELSTGGRWITTGDSQTAGLYVGNRGNGELRILSGGYAQARQVILGVHSGSHGTVLVDAATLDVKPYEDPSAYGTLYIGYNGTGTMTITHNSEVNAKAVSVGDRNTGELTIDEAGVLNTTGGNSAIGTDTGGDGFVTVRNGGTWRTAHLFVGAVGDGRLDVAAGGTVTSTSVSIAGGLNGSNGVATVLGVGAKWNIGTFLIVGAGGTGTLAVGAGGALTSETASIGFDAVATGYATVGGAPSLPPSSWTLSNSLFVGDRGYGRLTIGALGTVSSTKGYVGNYADSTGLVNVNGSAAAWNLSDDLLVGVSGTGTLNIGTGGTVSNQTGYIGNNGGGQGAVNVTGGLWNNALDIAVGHYGAGSLTISDGGEVRARTAYLGLGPDSQGTLTLGTGGTLFVNGVTEAQGTGTFAWNGGTLKARAANANFIADFEPGDVTIGSSGGILDTNGFDLGITTALSGAGILTKRGLGTLTLSGANTVSLALEAGNLVIASGSSLAPPPGGNPGVLLTGSGTLTNRGSITGGTGLLNGGAGVRVTAGATVINDAGSTITGGLAGLLEKIDVGVQFINGAGTLVNRGTINGGVTMGDFANTVTLHTGGAITNGGLNMGTSTLSSLTLAGAGTQSFAAATGTALVFNGTLTKAGIGVWSLDRGLSHTGGSRVKDGTLAIGAGGSITHAGADLFVGHLDGDTARLQLLNGGAVTNATGAIGSTAGAIGVGEILGGVWTNNGELRVGDSGTGFFYLSGGVVSNTYGNIARSTGSKGTAIVSGGTWNNSNTLVVGNQGDGLLTISNGVVNAPTVELGRQSAGTGEFQFNGGLLVTGNVIESAGGGTMTWNGGTLRLTQNQSALFAGFEAGDVTLSAGGAILDTQAFAVASALGLSGSGALTKTGSGTLTLTGANTYTGGTRVGGGTLVVTGSLAHPAGNLTIGFASGDDAGVRIASGGSVSSALGVLGSVAGSTGAATINGGAWTNTGELRVGDSGAGTLDILGGALSGTYGNIARESGSTGTVTMSGGTWTSSNWFVVGNAGTGAFTQAGGTVTSNGGRIGLRSGGTGVATLGGGAWNLTGSLIVGDAGTGTLNLLSGGAATVTGGTLRIGDTAGGNGTLNFGAYDLANATGAGALTASAITFGVGTGVINFNQTDSLTLAASISGHGAVNQRGAGVTTLAAASTHTGETNILNGTLALSGDGALSGTSHIRIASGAAFDVSAVNFTLGETQALTGNGIVQGNIAVRGIVSPGNSIGALTVTGDFLWHAGATLLFELGAGENDLLTLGGDFLKSGAGNFAFLFENAGWQLNETYTLIGFDGATDFAANDFSFTNDGGFDGFFSVTEDSVRFTLTNIPEPSTGVLLGFALAVLARRSRCRFPEEDMPDRDSQS